MRSDVGGKREERKEIGNTESQGKKEESVKQSNTSCNNFPFYPVYSTGSFLFLLAVRQLTD